MSQAGWGLLIHDTGVASLCYEVGLPDDTGGKRVETAPFGGVFAAEIGRSLISAGLRTTLDP